PFTSNMNCFENIDRETVKLVIYVLVHRRHKDGLDLNLALRVIKFRYPDWGHNVDDLSSDYLHLTTSECDCSTKAYEFYCNFRDNFKPNGKDEGLAQKYDEDIRLRLLEMDKPAHPSRILRKVIPRQGVSMEAVPPEDTSPKNTSPKNTSPRRYKKSSGCCVIA
ncbi:MAG: hypothetical protein Q9224_006423, partial [Gallowayella concinna]